MDREGETQMASTDNHPLPENRRYRDTRDLGGAACRIVRVIGRRLADGDPEELTVLRELDWEVSHAWAAAVAGMRAAGFSDGDIGEALGVTKQAVQKRWGRGSGEGWDLIGPT